MTRKFAQQPSSSQPSDEGPEAKVLREKPLARIDEAASRDDSAAEEHGFGALQTLRGCLPLVAMDVRAQITDNLARTSVRQTFRNTLDESLEATYIFPLPDRAAVTRFQLHVAGRTLEGQLKERGQAREDYERAIEEGHRAAIAEEERSGVFTMRVGNIPPQEEAVVELTLLGPLPVADGEATYRFPLVVAPRYTPGVPLSGPPVGAGVGTDTDQVPDASRVTPPVLLPGFPNPVRLSLEVELQVTAAGQVAGACVQESGKESGWHDPAAHDPAVWSSRVRSSLHAVVSNDSLPLVMRLQPGERLDRDFILRFPIAGASASTSLQVTPAAAGKPGVFALTLLPPLLPADHRPAPREVVFLLDRSGSMGGWKMVAARRAVGRMVDTLLDQDRFTVLAFDSVVEFPPHLPQGLVEATNRQRWRMLEWLGKVEARGGTELGPALQHAVGCLAAGATGEPQPSGMPTERILIVVTDGQVSGEDAILRQMHRQFSGSLPAGATPRIFTVGIDRAVNAGFLRRLADFGNGACELVESEERLDEAMDTIHRRIGSPVLTDVRLEPLNFACIQDSLAPAKVADLFVDRPVMVLGRQLDESHDLRLRIHATDAAGNPWVREVAGQEFASSESAGPAGDNAGLLHLWGRSKVRDLEDQYAAGRARDSRQLMQRIVDVSLESHVLSRFTAYVAVDTSEVVNAAGRPKQVVQAVEMPSEWEMPAEPVCMSLGAIDAMDSIMAAAPPFLSPSPSAPSRKRLFSAPRSAAENPASRDRSVPKRRADRVAEPSALTNDARRMDVSEVIAAMCRSVVEGETAFADTVEKVLRELLSNRGQIEFHFEPLVDSVRVHYFDGGTWVELASMVKPHYVQLLEGFERLAGFDATTRDRQRQQVISRQSRGDELRIELTFVPTACEPKLTIHVSNASRKQPGKSRKQGPEKPRDRFWV